MMNRCNDIDLVRVHWL